MTNYLKEFKAIFIIILVMFIMSSVAYFMDILFSKPLYATITICYFVISIILLILRNYIKNKMYGKVIGILTFPLSLIYILFLYIIPFGTILTHIVLYLSLVVVIPVYLLKILLYFNLFSIESKELRIYIQITSVVFIAVLLNYQIRRLLYLISPARVKSSEKLKPYELDKLTDYFLSESNIRFMIYFIYALALIVVNIYKFQGKSIYESQNFDNIILQSFVTFMAFDRALTYLKQLEFKPSEFLLKIIKSINNKFDDEINKR